MGRKLDAILGRRFKPSKLRATVNLAVSRISVLKTHRQSRLTVASSDVIQLLNLNHHEQALIRVDHVIKEQNMLDVLAMVDGYCHLLLQMMNLIENEKGCPDELKEAVSSLLYAAPRLGEFPELQEVREILTFRYGKEFANGAMELRSNCGVNTRIIQKLSTRQSSLETRLKILQEIAGENGIILNLEDSSPANKEEHVESTPKGAMNDDIAEVLSFSESTTLKKKYRGVEDAAQAAFESAAYAAAAARAAVELSRSRSFGSDHPDSPNSRPRKVVDSNSEKSKVQRGETSSSENNINGGGSDSDGCSTLEKKKVVVDEEDDGIECESGGFSPLKEEMKMKMEIDLTKKPMSVRTRRVYGR